jgi:hygromycin-B 7''-O-kinase
MRGAVRLPEDIDPVVFDEQLRLAPEDWLFATREVCAAHALDSADARGFPDGSNLVASVANRWVVKIFPRFHRHQWESERRVLKHFAGRSLGVDVPALVAEGEREDGWTYVVIDQLPGVTLEAVWPELDHATRTRLLHDIGGIMSRVHALPVGDLADLDPEWEGFLAGQHRGARARHERLGAPDWLLRDLPRLLDEGVRFWDEPLVVLTGEYTPFNLLADEVDGVWRLSGMIDFGDAMVGRREYDFDGPCLFLCGGDAASIDALFSGYGRPSPRMDDALSRRLMQLAVLHRYANFRFQIRIDGWERRAGDLRMLEDLVFAR